MEAEALLILLLIGAIAGFLAGVIVKGYGFGVVGNVVIGIVGAVLGGWLLPQLGLFPGGSIAGQIMSATAGAVVLLVLISFVRRVAWVARETSADVRDAAAAASLTASLPHHSVAATDPKLGNSMVSFG
jgi:uncharacterized membrane protein YeaQ/YmgE (transglycosylase-associated protein family)